MFESFAFRSACSWPDRLATAVTRHRYAIRCHGPNRFVINAVAARGPDALLFTCLFVCLYFSQVVPYNICGSAAVYFFLYICIKKKNLRKSISVIESARLHLISCVPREQLIT